MVCGVGRRYGWDLALLWLWHRLVATATIQLLAWELSVLNKTKKKKKKKNAHTNNPSQSCMESLELFSPLPGLTSVPGQDLAGLKRWGAFHQRHNSPRPHEVRDIQGLKGALPPQMGPRGDCIGHALHLWIFQAFQWRWTHDFLSLF